MNQRKVRKTQEAAMVMHETPGLGLEVDLAETLAARGIDSGERVKARKPEIHRACVKLLGEGISPKKIEDLLGLDIRIVLEFQADGEATGTIPPYKERTLKQLRSVVTLCLDALIDKAKAGKISAIEVCALIDKAELLSGGVTSRAALVEDPRVGEFRRFMAAAQVPEMVLGAGEVFQKGAGLADGGAGSGAGFEDFEGARDIESPVIDV